MPSHHPATVCTELYVVVVVVFQKVPHLQCLFPFCLKKKRLFLSVVSVKFLLVVLLVVLLVFFSEIVTMQTPIRTKQAYHIKPACTIVKTEHTHVHAFTCTYTQLQYLTVFINQHYNGKCRIWKTIKFQLSKVNSKFNNGVHQH